MKKNKICKTKKRPEPEGSWPLKSVEERLFENVEQGNIEAIQAIINSEVDLNLKNHENETISCLYMFVPFIDFFSHKSTFAIFVNLTTIEILVLGSLHPRNFV